MTSPSNGPLVPVTLSEAVYAALVYALVHLRDNGSMPRDMQENLAKVATAYDRNRTMLMLQQHVPGVAVEKFAQSAADKLGSWLGAQEKQVKNDNADFEAWARELGSGDTA